MSRLKETNIKTFLAQHKMHRCFKFALIAITSVAGIWGYINRQQHRCVLHLVINLQYHSRNNLFELFHN